LEYSSTRKGKGGAEENSRNWKMGFGEKRTSLSKKGSGRGKRQTGLTRGGISNSTDAKGKEQVLEEIRTRKKNQRESGAKKREEKKEEWE